MNLDTKRILVVGSSGGVGGRLCREVIRLIGRDSLVVGDHKLKRGKTLAALLNAEFRHTDMHDLDEETLDRVDAVIVAASQQQPLIQLACIERRIPCIDINLLHEFARKIETLDDRAKSNGTPVIVMAGHVPGLSGVMVKQATKDYEKIEEIHVGLLQNSRFIPGAVGFAEMSGMLSKPVWYQKQRLNGFSQKREFVLPDPFRETTLRLFDYPEAHIIRLKCDMQEVYYWTGFEKERVNRLIVLLSRLKVLNLFNSPRIRVGAARIFVPAYMVFARIGKRIISGETTALTVEISGTKHGKHCITQKTLVSASDYSTTAMSAVAMTKLILSGDVQVSGVRYPLEVFTLPSLIATMDSPDVKLVAPLDTVSQ